jgi:hypothetical protein
MAQCLYLREQGERLRCLARDSADRDLRDRFLRLAARAAALQGIECPAENTGSNNQGAA